MGAGEVVAYCAALNPGDMAVAGSHLEQAVRRWPRYVAGRADLRIVRSAFLTDRLRLDAYCDRARAAGAIPPLVCAPHGERLLVLDGTHRLRAARAAGIRAAGVLVGVPAPAVMRSWPLALREEVRALLRGVAGDADWIEVCRLLPHLRPEAPPRSPLGRWEW
ncbi:MAG: hypothetical protein MUE51_01905 [Thermoleophilia bacterium]|nr:hypothetical protein [Thermoleophilia bacterium]